jgi:hypothetical protein
MDQSNFNIIKFIVYLIIFRYDGEWKDDKKHGYGVLIWPNG